MVPGGVVAGGGLVLLRPARWILLAALLTAGCLSGDEAPAPTDDTIAPQAEPAAMPAAAATAAAPPAAPATTPPTEIPLSWDGTTRPMVCIRAGAPACGAGAPTDGSERYTPEIAGTPLGFHVTLTWTATTPATQTLVLHVEGADCNGHCYAMGTSPLVYALDEVDLLEGEPLVFHPFVPCQPCGSDEHMMDPGQSVHLEGTLLVR